MQSFLPLFPAELLQFVGMSEGMEFLQFVLGTFGVAIAFIAGALLLFVNLLFARGVMRDGDRLRELGFEPRFVGPGTWAIGVVFGSFAVVALYWFIHHSRLRTPLAPVVGGRIRSA